MKKMTGKVLACTALVLLTACAGKDLTYRIVETTDVHGNIFSMDFMSEGNPEKPGGLARVSTFLTEQKKTFGKRLIYVDNGDFLQGDISVYYDRTADYDSISTTAALLDYLGCEVSNAGNHDIAIGFGALDKFMYSVKHPVICSNLVFEEAPDQTVFLPYTIVERKGLKIAFVGMITPTTLKKLAPSNYIGLEVEDLAERASRIVPEIRAKENPDLVIGLFHSGEEDCEKVAEQVTGVDAILYGHDHVANCIPVINAEGDSVWMVNPGDGANNVALLDIKVSGKGDARKISLSASLKDVSSTPVDARMIERFSGKIAAVVHYADSVIGVLGDRVETSAVPGPNTMMDLVHTIMMSAVSVQISLAQPQIEEGFLDAGQVTPRDMARLFPRENTVSMVMLTGTEIIRLLEYSAQKILDGEKMGYFTAQGIDYVVDASAEYGKRVKVLSMSDGAPFDEKKVYRTGIDSFFAAGGLDMLTDVAGIKPDRLSEREVMATGADLRFHAITRFSLSREAKRSVFAERKGNWSVINLN